MDARDDRTSLNAARTNDAGGMVERYSDLVAALRGLLNGSLEALDQFEKAVKPGPTAIETAIANLSTAGTTLEKLADLVHASMQGPGLSIGSPLLAKCAPVTLGVAVGHAIDLIRPGADAMNIAIETDLAADVAGVPAGPMYPALINGLRNALESIAARDERTRVGCIRVSGRRETFDGPRPITTGLRPAPEDWAVIEIEDDGLGPPEGADAARVFDPGFTTKDARSGLGLSVAWHVMAEARGTVQLMPRMSPAGKRLRGAVLRLGMPIRDAGATTLGLPAQDRRRDGEVA